MRIVMVAHSDAPWTPHYARHGQRAGHDVTVISFAPARIDGVRTLFVGREPYLENRNKDLFLTRVPAIRKLLRSLRPDVVFAPYLISNGLAAALSWHGPLVVSARGADVIAQPGSLGAPGWFLRRLVRFICGRARMVHAVSEELVDALAAYGVPRVKIECFPVGVDTTRFVPGRERPDSGPAVEVVCTRSHELVYENHVIVEAVAALRKQGRALRCTFAGSGRLLEERRAQAKELGAEDVIRFIPRIDHDRVPDLLRSAQIYVSASSSDGTSSSLLEAMATGLLPVVTRIRANEAWVTDGETGVLFGRGNSPDLARALARAMDDAALRMRALAANRRLVELKGNQDLNNRRLMDLLARAADLRPTS